MTEDDGRLDPTGLRVPEGGGVVEPATFASWLVALIGQAVAPAWIFWMAMWTGWAASFDPEPDPRTAQLAWAAAAVSAVAWLGQLLLTARRRRRGGAAISGIVFLVLGALWTLLLAGFAAGMTS